MKKKLSAEDAYRLISLIEQGTDEKKVAAEFGVSEEQALSWFQVIQDIFGPKGGTP